MDGPITLNKIVIEAERLGEALGIPREQAIVYARMELLQEKINQAQQEEKSNGWKEFCKFLRNVVRHIDGLLDRYIGK